MCNGLDGGQIFSWGRHSNGRLGLGPLDSNVNKPRMIKDFGGKITSITCGLNFR